jgi:hypothetical protein
MKDSFVIYTEYTDQIDELTNEEAGIIFRAIFAYVRGMELPEEVSTDRTLRLIFNRIKRKLDEDGKKYAETCEARKAAGSQGGRPRKTPEKQGVLEESNENNENQKKAKKANGFSEKQKKQIKAKKADNDSDYDSDNDSYPPYNPPTGDGERDFKAKFFSVYCQFKKFAGKDYPEIDFERLLDEFNRSSQLRKMFSWQVILGSYPAIIRGDFRDADKPNPFAGIDAKAARERWYAERRAKAEGQAESVLERFLQNEDFKRIHKRLNAIPCEIGKAEYQAENGDAKAQKQLVKLTQEKARLTLQYRGIIERNDMTEEDLLPKWHCKKCQDTGYMTDDRMCDCYEVAL